MIVPIFIYRDRKSKEELREEAERRRRLQDDIAESEARLRRERAREREERRRLKEKERWRLETEYYEDRRKNPWDYQFLPEGWSPLGQTYITPIDEPWF